MKKLILIGGGGHCRSCIEVIRSQEQYEIAGILDRTDAGDAVSGYPVLGDDGRIAELAGSGYEFLITVGQVKNGELRRRLFQKVKEAGGKLATIIASTAFVSGFAVLGEGTIVMHGAFVNAGASVGLNGIINTKAVVEHDAVIGDHCHVSTGSIVNGNCSIGDGSLVGSGAVIRQGIVMGERVTIGAGAVVVKNIASEGIYAGNPAVLIGK